MGFFSDVWSRVRGGVGKVYNAVSPIVSSIKGGIGKVAGVVKDIAGKVGKTIHDVRNIASRIGNLPVIGTIAKDMWDEIPFHNEIASLAPIVEDVSNRIGSVAGQVKDVSDLKLGDVVASLPALKDSISAKTQDMRQPPRRSVMAPYRV